MAEAAHLLPSANARCILTSNHRAEEPRRTSMRYSARRHHKVEGPDKAIEKCFWIFLRSHKSGLGTPAHTHIASFGPVALCGKSFNNNAGPEDRVFFYLRTMSCRSRVALFPLPSSSVRAYTRAEKTNTSHKKRRGKSTTKRRLRKIVPMRTEYIDPHGSPHRLFGAVMHIDLLVKDVRGDVLNGEDERDESEKWLDTGVWLEANCLSIVSGCCCLRRLYNLHK
jgi:hypothetical protein